jgi:ribonuclease P protein component
VAFCWKSPLADGPKVGFTTPRALGKAVVRNRMRRRLREVVRVRLSQLAPEWRIVWNLRRAALTAPVEKLAGEVERVFERCKP